MADAAPAETAVDLAIIGAGVSGALTLVQLLANAQARPPAPPLRVHVYDREGEFGGGLAYGKRSGRNSLLISSAGGAVPGFAFSELVAYLRRTKADWLSELQTDPITRAWSEQHAAAIAADEYGDLFLPRFLIHDFITDKVQNAILQARTAGVAHVELIPAAVEEITRDATGFNLRVVSPGGSVRAYARRVLLAVGIPPPPEDVRLGGRHNYFCNMYAPGLAENMALFQANIAQTRKPVHLTIVGSNAAALEMLFFIQQTPAIRDRLKRILLLSPSGRLPDPWRGQDDALDFPILRTAANDATGLTADQVIGCTLEDVQLQRAAGRVSSEFAIPLLRSLFAVLGQMPPHEQRNFVERYTYRIVRTIANGAGAEYLDAAYDLQTRGILECRRGRFTSVAISTPGNLSIKYHNLVKDKTVLEETQGVIMCAGYATLPRTRDPLLQQLQREPSLALRINQSERGFAVDDDYQASPNFFVHGALLCGISNARGTVFDLENTSRLWQMAIKVAEQISLRFTS